MKQKLIQIANYQYSSEAYLYKAKLESEGIEVFLQNENTVNTEPAWSNAVGGVKLFVLSDDVMKAKNILKTISEYSITDYGDFIKCPNCQEEKTTMVTSVKDLKSFFGFLFSIIIGALPLFAKHKYKCESCNFEF